MRSSHDDPDQAACLLKFAPGLRRIYPNRRGSNTTRIFSRDMIRLVTLSRWRQLVSCWHVLALLTC